jgi:predicted MPP superfamily phosphohydrolase
MLTVLLSHNPDVKEEVAPRHWQLMLSGHTHGGQLRVPWLGATPFAPVRDKRFVAGLHRWNDRWIHVTKGVGNVYGMRINCPPEISFLTLT